MDLLQTQIKESCNLALPEGLKDLMSDISREVLRAQPNNIPQFIANYLEVLLEVREKLSIACDITNDTCRKISDLELYNDFKAIGLSEEDIDIATKIVEKHLDQRNVKEQSLLIKLAKKTSIDEMQLSSMRDAIQKAFKRHHIKDGVLSGSENKDNKVRESLHHTMDWYKKNRMTTEEVFIAPNFEPCESTVSVTDPALQLKIPKYKAHSGSGNEKECASFDYTSNSASTGKVKFVDEKILLKTSNSENDDISDEYNANMGIWKYGDENNLNYKHKNDDYIADMNDMNAQAELTDNDIEENIKSDSDDEISSVDDDFGAESECDSKGTLLSL